MDEKKLWKKCAEFHGHECGGLTIGYKASLYVLKLLEVTVDEERGCASGNEQIVCIAENDACGIDAIQVILGCSIGKGNLLFHLRGKQAFSFYNRNNGKSVRLVLKPRSEQMTRAESFIFYQKAAPEEIFEVKQTTIELPEQARLFDSYVCECCGEVTGANWIRLDGEKKVCLDCYQEYCRFEV